jgi:hypothetical protein
MVLRNSPCMAARLRILASGCHAMLPLVVVAAQLDTELKQRIREAFLTVHKQPLFSQWLHERAIERFVPALNTPYQDAQIWHERAQRRSKALLVRETAMERPVAALSQHSR